MDAALLSPHCHTVMLVCIFKPGRFPCNAKFASHYCQELSLSVESSAVAPAQTFSCCVDG